MANTVVPQIQTKTAEKYNIIRSLNLRTFIDGLCSSNNVIKWYKNPEYDANSQTINFYSFTAIIDKTFILFGDPTQPDSIMASVNIVDNTKTNYVYVNYKNTENSDTQQQAKIIVDTQTYSGSEYLYLGYVKNDKIFMSNQFHFWNSDNDGPGSGLNADKLDGHHSNYFAKTSLSNISDSIILNKVKNVDGSGSGLDADKLDGYDTSQTPLANAIPITDENGTLNNWVTCSGSGDMSRSVYDKNNNNIVDNAEKLNGCIASAIPNGNVIPIADKNGKLDAWVTNKELFINVKDYGAKGDGSADDTSAIQNAINDVVSAGGGKVFIPKGTYIVGKITLKSNVWLVGEGPGTILKLKNNANTDLLYGDNSDNLWGSGKTDGVANVGLFDLVLDGNRANNSSGSCISIYGRSMRFFNLYIKNAPEYGIRTDYGSWGEAEFGMEGFFINIYIDTCGKHGWYNSGPHDSHFENVIIVDASQSQEKTYDGMYLDNWACKFMGLHCWTRSSAKLSRTPLEIIHDYHRFTNCHFEAGWVANTIIAGSGNVFDDNCNWYAPANGTNIWMYGVAQQNFIKGHITEKGSDTAPDPYGIVLGKDDNDWIKDNKIEVFMTKQEAGNIKFNRMDGSAPYVGGNNDIFIKAFNHKNVTFTGNPGYHDKFRIEILRDREPYEYNYSNYLMTKDIYDTDDDGVIDNAKKLDGIVSSVTPSANTIPIADSSGTLNKWITSGNEELFINVKDYGAKGDGVTDDTTAIQNAINDATNKQKGTIVFPAGTYVISDTLTIENIKQNVSYIGGAPNCHFTDHTELHLVGLGKARISVNANMQNNIQNVIHFVNNPDNGELRNCSITNIQIDGNNKATNGVVFDSCPYSAISHCFIHDVDTGVLCANAPGGGVYIIEIIQNTMFCNTCISCNNSGGGSIIANNDLYAKDNGTNISMTGWVGRVSIFANTLNINGSNNVTHIKLLGDPNNAGHELRDIIISDNEFMEGNYSVYAYTDNEWGGDCSGTYKGEIYSIDIHDNHNTCTNGQFYFHGVRELKFYNNTIRRYKSVSNEGLRLENCEKPIITNNTFAEFQGSVIYLDNTSRGIIQGNSIWDFGQDGTSPAVKLNSNCGNNMLALNSLYQWNSNYSTQSFVESDNTNDYNAYIYNKTVGCDSPQIHGLHSYVTNKNNSGSGDMLKSIYDTNNNGIVDNAERVIGKVPTITPTANAIPIADANGTLNNWVTNSGNGIKSNIDGGRADSVYTASQIIDGGNS